MSERRGETGVCPECDFPVDPTTQQLCPKCGYPLMFSSPPQGDPPPPITREPGAGHRAAPLEPPTREVADPNSRECAVCGHRSSPARVRCERCGAAMGTVTMLVELPPGPPAPEPRLAWDKYPIVVSVLAVVAVLLVSAWFALRESDSSDGSSTKPGPDLQKVPAGDVSVRASSHLKTDRNLTYFACNVLDADADTAWNSAKDQMVGATLAFSFSRPVQLRSVTIVNGYAKSDVVFEQNAAVSMATVVAGTTTLEWDLEDTREPQTLSHDFGATTGVVLRVDEVRAGTDFDEVAVTEVWFEEQALGSAGPTRSLDVRCPPRR